MSQMTELSGFEFPTEIKELISSLKNEKQWKILEFLLQNNNELSYTKLKEKLGISNDEKFKLTYHLKELTKNGWLRNQVKPNKGISKEQSFYIINDFGLKMINSAVKTTDIQSYNDDAWEELVNTIGQIEHRNSLTLPFPSLNVDNDPVFLNPIKQSASSAIPPNTRQPRNESLTASG